MQSVGFALLTHAAPGQVVRLARKLTCMFDAPPILVHHDFSQSLLREEDLPANVCVVRPSLRTAWASFSLVVATVRLLQEMVETRRPPDWIVLLSESDYPIKPAARIVEDLYRGDFDAHIEFQRIEPTMPQTELQRWYGARYWKRRIARVPYLNRRLRLRWYDVRVGPPFVPASWLPFSAAFRCYAGSQWFAVNRSAAEHIVQFYHGGHALTDHYRTVPYADESYFQCALANAPHLRLNNANWRFLDWGDGAAHPLILGEADLPRLAASQAHFARKFDFESNPELLPLVDALSS